MSDVPNPTWFAAAWQDGIGSLSTMILYATSRATNCEPWSFSELGAHPERPCCANSASECALTSPQDYSFAPVMQNCWNAPLIPSICLVVFCLSYLSHVLIWFLIFTAFSLKTGSDGYSFPFAPTQHGCTSFQSIRHSTGVLHLLFLFGWSMARVDFDIGRHLLRDVLGFLPGPPSQPRGSL